jgi:hypothetical protein
MLKVKVNKIVKIGKKYCVFLDSDNKFYFDNKRKAEDMLRFISKELDSALFFLNEEYCEIEKIYRQYYFEDDDFKFRFSLQNSLECIRNRMNACLLQPETENRNTIVYKALEGSFLELLSVYKTLENKSISRCDTVTRKRLQNKYRIVELYMTDFKKFEEKTNVKESSIELVKHVKLRRVV